MGCCSKLRCVHVELALRLYLEDLSFEVMMRVLELIVNIKRNNEKEREGTRAWIDGLLINTKDSVQCGATATVTSTCSSAKKQHAEIEFSKMRIILVVCTVLICGGCILLRRVIDLLSTRDMALCQYKGETITMHISS